jgi:TDG/mug DNA glycosylase family protein
LFRSVFERPVSQPVRVGLQSETLEGAGVFVLPNPSGRNANFSYAEMLAAFSSLARFAKRTRRS